MLSLTEIEQAFQACKAHKSPGLDQVPGDLLRLFPAMFAELCQPLFCKAATRVQQPIQFRGGVLAEAYKNSGSPAITSNYRALLVSWNVGKAYHRAIRTKILGPAERVVGDLHYGVRKGASVVQASQALILHEKACSGGGRSTGYLFLDTKSAYYAIIRQLVYGSSLPADTDAVVQRILGHFELPHDAWQMLVQVIANGRAMALELTHT